MKIAIVHPFDRAKWTEPLQHDGLHAALKIVSKKYQVDWFMEEDIPDDSYDWIIPWGVGSLPFNFTIEKYHGRKALLCAGHPEDLHNIDKFDAVFVESPYVYDYMKPYCKKIVLAFGTDTDFFKPLKESQIFDAFFPATFSSWKRQDLFAGAVGRSGLVGGVVQPDGAPYLNSCINAGLHTLAGLIPSVLIAKLYNMSKTVVVTAWHGSERTVLEAMSSNIPLVVVKDNPLACSLLTDECIMVEPTLPGIHSGFIEALGKEVNTREHVLKNYSHEIYAQKLLEVLES